MTLDLYLVRHGATAPNAERCYPGAGEDAPLSLAGEGQARCLGLPLMALAFASPNLRATQTARLAGFDPVQSPDLREAGFGVMAGRTWAELEAEFGDGPRAWIEGLADPDSDLGPPEGESGRSFHARIRNWLNALPTSGEVAAFTHLGPVLAALRLTVGLNAADVPPGSAVHLRRSEGAWWLVSLTPGRKAAPLIFVTGGARSGKSGYAERLALDLGGEGVTCLATAERSDEEMTARIERHRADRPAAWTTVEAPLNVPEAVRNAATPVVLLDCLSLWVSNLMFAGLDDAAVLARVDDLVRAERPGTLIAVSNEVGSGIVPEHPLARRYRDLLGWVNAKVAAAAGEAYLLVSGQPLRLK